MRADKSQRIEAQIRDAITGLRPLLRRSAPDAVGLVSFDLQSGVVILHLDGDCPDCEMPMSALLQGIEAHLKLRVPEIREVRVETTGKV
jgi:Fe-S cluster biogenesis protein NfuA